VRRIDIGDMVWYDSETAVVVDKWRGHLTLVLPSGKIVYELASTACKATGSSQAKKDIEIIIKKLDRKFGF